MIGVVGLLSAVPKLLVLLALSGIFALTPLWYALIKGVWTGAPAALVVPLVIRNGLKPEAAGA